MAAAVTPTLWATTSPPFLFWLSSYHELNDKYADALHRKYPGVMVVLSQVVNLLLVADYMYVFMVTARSRRPVLLPQTI